MTSVTPFEFAFRNTMDYEGGGKLHKHPRDPGGTTKWGFSQRAHPGIDIENLTEAQAKDLARVHYWDEFNGDKMAGQGNELLAIATFDFCFNSGVRNGAAYLQRAANAWGAGLVIDADIGPKSLNAFLHIDERELLSDYHRMRAQFLSRLDHADVFGRGWLNRTYKVMFSLGVYAMHLAALQQDDAKEGK